MRPAWLFVAFLVSALPAQAQMYKCKDARGVTQYTDKPCADGKGGAVDIRGQPPISGKVESRGSDVGAAEREFQGRRIERAREEEAVAARAEQQKRRCAAMHSQLDFLTRFNTISKMNEKGERVYMDDATRNAQVEQLRTAIARDCR
jgi:uncharacterized protein YcfJ